MKKLYEIDKYTDVIVTVDMDEYQSVDVKIVDGSNIVFLADYFSFNEHNGPKQAIDQMHRIASTLITVANDLEELVNKEEE